MLNFKKVNCKKVIINAVIVFCVFALTIVIIRIDFLLDFAVLNGFNLLTPSTSNR